MSNDGSRKAGRQAFWVGLAVVLIAVILDQLTKLAAQHWLTPYRPQEVLPLLNLTLSYNPGAAFSFLAQGGGWQRWLFSALAVAVAVYIMIWLWRFERPFGWQAAGLALIAGGAVGNLIDRLAYGHVIDFIDVHYAGWHWPAFNVADSAITVGAAIIVVQTLFGSEGEG